MLDLTFGKNLGRSAGISRTIPVSSLNSFLQVRLPSESTFAAKAKNSLVYCPSYELEEGAYGELKKSGGALVFSFSDIIQQSGFRRAIMISKMRLAFLQCRKSGCGFVVCTLAKSQHELRNAHELESFKHILGMSMHEREFADKTLERLAKAGLKEEERVGK
jgi:hypothetical protein